MERLETPRLILRDWAEDDLEDLYRYARDPEVGPAAGWKPHETLEDSKKILTESFIGSDEVWALEDRETGQVIGSLGLHRDAKRPGVPDVKMLGYVLSREHWGKGLMTEAVAQVLRYAFEEEGLSLVSVYHYPFNGRSRRVIEKAGFRQEGVLRQAVRRYDGVILDHVCYSMTAEEYRARKEERSC